ncbi:MAG: diacylglycerol kinase, partial [Halanaerobiales bacterium]
MHFERVVDSLNYAFEGIVHTLKTQRNMKIHFAIAFLVLLASLFVEISKLELIIIFFAITLVIAL